MSQVEYKPIKCQNCGDNSHCGSVNWREIRDYGVDCEPYYIKACDACRCKECTNDKKVHNK